MKLKLIERLFINNIEMIMHYSKKIFYSILFFFILINSNNAQENSFSDLENSQIMVVSRPTKDDKIMLRWAVTTPIASRKINTYGYKLTRYTIIRNGSILSEPIITQIGVFKPKPLNEWESIVRKNNNAAVMAQSIFGKSFNIEGIDELSSIINLAEEQEQRFTWGLYAADQDFLVAQMAGLGFIDNTISPDEKYLYKVTSLVPLTELNIKEGGVFTGAKDYEELPKPLDLAATFTEDKAMLSWNYEIHKTIYNSYFIERSESGNMFKRVNDLPLTTLNNSEKTNVKRMFYIDSIVTNKRYYYRVMGRTPFGEFGPVSEVVSGKGKKVFKYVPRITTKKYLNAKSVILKWEFSEEGNEYIKGFQLNRSDKDNGIYETVIENIPATTRKIQYDGLQPTNYMTITAIGKEGGSRTSLSSLVQAVDSIPPTKPIQFNGKIDSLGIVTLEWKANTEKDMLGYRVFRGNNKNEEYSQLTISPHKGTKYYDSISVKNLNTKVFYRLVAVDQRFNMSEPSDVLFIEKPDYIKPTQPVFKSFNIKEGKVNLVWANSSSEDVIKHEVYRKEDNDTDWQLIHTITKDEAQIQKTEAFIGRWIDENTVEKKQYYYTIIAIDNSGLESDPAPPLTLIIPKTGLAPPIKRLGSFIDKENNYVELFWKRYEEKNVAKIVIYKGLKGKPVSLLKNVLANTKRIVDFEINPNNEYVYMLRAVFKDGSFNEVTKLNIKY